MNLCIFKQIITAQVSLTAAFCTPALLYKSI